MPKWLLPTISEILAISDPAWSASGRSSGQPGDGRLGRTGVQRVRAEREWSGAIAALSALLQQQIQPTIATQSSVPQGLVLSGPLPVLSHPDLTTHLATRTLTVSALELPSWMPFHLLPASEKLIVSTVESTTPILPLLPGDPLAAEQFCLVLTPWFSMVMVLGESLTGNPAFMFSFMPEVIERTWAAIRPRILLMSLPEIDPIDELVRQFPPVTPDYQTVTQFSRLLLAHLPDSLEDPEVEAARADRSVKPREPVFEPKVAPEAEPLPVDQAPDVELLQALAHEIRTPLTTIRTLTRLLLRRKDLPPDVLKRLEIIDRECNEQIDRFNLIFRAVELETSTTHSTALTRTSLAQVFQQGVPRWQQQATQRNLTLDVVLPQKMPAVVSDPAFLDKALTSLIERFTRSLPSGSHIQVEVMLAGSQLKLQLQSQPHANTSASNSRSRHHHSPLKSIGQLLMFQPETGSLSLNLTATKNLFQALGGKLIVRDRPQHGEVMTVFLPLEMSSFPLDVNYSEVREA